MADSGNGSETDVINVEIDSGQSTGTGVAKDQVGAGLQANDNLAGSVGVGSYLPTVGLRVKCAIGNVW